ncbi:peptide/nickel transport system substrate-binding protein [Streptomonospora nanhaiensis]|uniref:Peptide/nickel transport system substrate-binding protein n=2 Tax=Streptomonospora nanhaiensis TaxID=1323731 RepID=A0A853BLM7_9ACTN|nr:ABC transporter family substrate-binding protein [Streptomonospora nanhaiensis]NYI95604.1 peptide/nickel transport system substrate-binding protein [Streptomonospora nanhaiensis]
MRMRRAAKLGAPLVVLALAASACGGGGGDEGNENQETLADIPAIDINQTDRADLQEGGTFHWGINEFPPQYQVHHTQGNLANAERIVSAVMPQAHYFDQNGEPHPDEDYVLSSEISDDGRTLTFELNPDAEWSNGEPITWEDYAAQVETVGGHRDNDSDFDIGDKTGYERIGDVEQGEDEYEVVFHFDEPFAEWPRLFDALYPKEYMEDPDKFNEDYELAFPVTAGPFGDVEFDETAQTITVNRDDNWWGEPAILDSIVFHTYGNDALPGVMNNGEIDGFYLGYDAAAYELLSDADGVRLTKAIDNAYRHITFNAGEGRLLADREVRNALVHAIDRSQMAQATLSGVNWTTDPTVNRLIRSSQTGFRDNSEGFGEYDPELAAQMLEDAGWTLEGEGEVRTKDGERLELDWVIPSDLQNTADEAEIAKAQLAEVGVAVNVETVPSNAYFPEYVVPGEFDATTFVYSSTNPYAGYFAENFTGPVGEDEDGNPTWGNNLHFSSTDEINEAFDELSKETDPEAYAEQANEIDRMLWEESMAVPLFQRPGIYAVNPNVANWGANGLASIEYTDIGFVE